MIEGMGLFLGLLFYSFPYERVLLDVPEYNLPLLAACSPALVTVEGSISGYYSHGGRRWDRCYLSIWRRRWEPFGAAFLARPPLRGSDEPG